MALRNLLVRVGADVSGLSQGLKKAQKDVKYFGRNVTGSLKEIQGKMAGLGAVLGGGFVLGGAIQDAMRYEALMATLGESLGASRKDFEKWQKDVGRSLGFSQLQSAETASIMSLNFKKIATSQEDLLQKTTKMMEVAAVISNKRGMTMQETSDRIRSALNGEADGADELGVNVRISAMKQSEAYRQMADGTPWDQLSDNMQTTIRYHHILNEVSRNLGMTIQDTTSQRMAIFTATLADLKVALGQAFLPILHVVLPILTTLANALIRVLQVIGAFMRALFGKGFKFKAPVSSGDVKNTQNQAKALDGVGKSADKAGKKSAKAGEKAKKAWSGTFGFDEVHTIKEPEAPAGGGAGGGGGARAPVRVLERRPAQRHVHHRPHCCRGTARPDAALARAARVHAVGEQHHEQPALRIDPDARAGEAGMPERHCREVHACRRAAARLPALRPRARSRAVRRWLSPRRRQARLERSRVRLLL